MNSDRRILALALVALATSACLNRQGTEPPVFPAGGLLARTVAAADLAGRAGRHALREPGPRALGPRRRLRGLGAFREPGGGHPHPDRERRRQAARHPRSLLVRAPRLRGPQPGVPRRRNRDVRGDPSRLRGLLAVPGIPRAHRQGDGAHPALRGAAIGRGGPVPRRGGRPGRGPARRRHRLREHGAGRSAHHHLHRAAQESARERREVLPGRRAPRRMPDRRQLRRLREHRRDLHPLEAARRRLPRDRRPAHQGQRPRPLPPRPRLQP